MTDGQVLIDESKFEEYESIYNEDLTKKIDELRNDIKKYQNEITELESKL